MPPSELRRRFSAKDVAQILGYELLLDRWMKEQQRDAELEAKAKAARSNALGR